MSAPCFCVRSCIYHRNRWLRKCRNVSLLPYATTGVALFAVLVVSAFLIDWFDCMCPLMTLSVTIHQHVRSRNCNCSIYMHILRKDSLCYIITHIVIIKLHGLNARWCRVQRRFVVSVAFMLSVCIGLSADYCYIILPHFLSISSWPAFCLTTPLFQTPSVPAAHHLAFCII